MNWYKKSQLLMNDLDLGWDRFRGFYGAPWKHVLLLDVGNPTKEEKRKIGKLKLYNDVISPETINLLQEKD